MKKLLIKCANILYFFFKLFPTKKRITMISRQENEVTLDFGLLKKEIEKRDKSISVKVLCHKLEGGEKAAIIEKIKYIFHCFKQMYYIATSKVVILDSYCILISILHHKKDLTIIQMWHSMGTMKKFGYQIVGMKEGANQKTAEDMKMHRNYNYVFASSKEYAQYLVDGFGCDISLVRIFSLPRVDLLTSSEYKQEARKKIAQKYPQINEKKNIVYCPTFRKNEKEMIEEISKLVENVNYDKYNLILKMHPLSKINMENNENVIYDKEFSSFDMLFIADYIISDYSCIIYEAAVLDIPLYFWAFDLEKYIQNRGLTFDYKNEVPGPISSDIKELLRKIQGDNFDKEALRNFRKKYVCNIENCTEKIVDFVLDNL